MALRQRVEDYIGSFSDTTALNAWLVESARAHIDISPVGKLLPYLLNVETNLPSPTDSRILNVFRKTVTCRRGTGSFKAQYADQGSLYFGHEDDPVFVIENDTITIFPDSEEPSADYIPYPTSIDCTADSEISNTPRDLTGLVVIDVAIKAAHQLLGDMTTQYAALTLRLDTEEDIELAMTKLKELEVKILDYRTKIATMRDTYTMMLSQYSGRSAVPSQQGQAQ